MTVLPIDSITDFKKENEGFTLSLMIFTNRLLVLYQYVLCSSCLLKHITRYTLHVTRTQLILIKA
jgi:hypothetical protein